MPSLVRSPAVVNWRKASSENVPWLSVRLLIGTKVEFGPFRVTAAWLMVMPFRYCVNVSVAGSDAFQVPSVSVVPVMSLTLSVKLNVPVVTVIVPVLVRVTSAVEVPVPVVFSRRPTLLKG